MKLDHSYGLKFLFCFSSSRHSYYLKCSILGWRFLTSLFIWKILASQANFGMEFFSALLFAETKEPLENGCQGCSQTKYCLISSILASLLEEFFYYLFRPWSQDCTDENHFRMLLMALGSINFVSPRETLTLS